MLLPGIDGRLISKFAFILANFIDYQRKAAEKKIIFIEDLFIFKQ